VHKVDDAIYELESPSQAGNLNSTPEYTLSMIEKSLNNATDFATIYNLYLGGDVGGDHVDVIKSANEFAQSLVDVLINTKGITRLASDDDAVDKIIGVAKSAGDVGLRFFENLQSYKMDLLQPSQRKDVATRNNSQARVALTKLSEVVDGLVSKGAKAGRWLGQMAILAISLSRKCSALRKPLKPRPRGCNNLCRVPRIHLATAL
jgi:hypothetical protein